MNAYFDALSKSLKRHGVDVTRVPCGHHHVRLTAPVPNACPTQCRASPGSMSSKQSTSEQHDLWAPPAGRAAGWLRLLGTYRRWWAPRIQHFGRPGQHGRTPRELQQATSARTRWPRRSCRISIACCCFARWARSSSSSRCHASNGDLGQEGGGVRIATCCARGFTEALEAFRAQRWIEAAALFEGIIERFSGDGPSLFYLSYCRRYAADGPDDGDPAIIRLDANRPPCIRRDRQQRRARPI